MYRIITDNQKILEYAKECGAQILEIKKPLVVEIGEKRKCISTDIVEKFLLKFKEINMENIEIQVLKFILEHKLGNKNKTTICTKVAKIFKKSAEWADDIIGNVYVQCITNLPKEYIKHFDGYECYIHMMLSYRYDFLKACQEYLNKNTAIVDNSGDKLYIVL